MSNYGTALNYAATAADSLGTASSKFDDAYLESIEAATNRLTSAWQEFSYEVLNAGFVKQLLEWVTNFINLLTTLAEHIDLISAILPFLGAIITEVFGKKLIAAAKNVSYFNSVAATVITISSFVTSLISSLSDENAINGVLKLGAAVSSFGAAIAGVATKMPAMVVIQAFLVAIMAFDSAMDTFIKDAGEVASELKEIADEATSRAQEQNENTEELISLYQQYRNTVKDVTDLEELSEAQKEELVSLQEKIAEIVGKEAAQLDLVNKKSEENIELLKEQLKLQSQKQYIEALGAYESQKDYYDNSNITPSDDTISSNILDADIVEWSTPGVINKTINFMLEKMLNEKYGNGSNFVFSNINTGSDAGENVDEIIGWLVDELEGAGVNAVSMPWGQIGDLYTILGIEENADPETVYNALESTIDKIVKSGYTRGNAELYNIFTQWKEELGAAIEAVQNSSDSLLNSIINKIGFDLDIDKIQTQSEYESAFQAVYERVMEDKDVLELIAEETQDATSIKEAIEDWFEVLYNLDFTSEGKVNFDATFASFSSFRSSFEALNKALESFRDGGVIAADIIEEILEQYPELMKYFRLSPDGYIPAIGPDDTYAGYSDLDLLYDWGAGFLQKYVDALAACEEGTDDWAVANENLATAMAYVSTLIREELIEQETEKLEAQQEALEKQLEQYRRLIEERKELLNTYKEEIDYQKELEEKQDNVASLQTQLAVARLDTSAAGQARVRELEEELAEAQEELDDFTLEHAIEVLTEQLDTSLEDYEAFIEEQVDRIETAIENLKFTVNPTPVVPDPSEPEEDEGDEGADTDIEIKPDDSGNGETKPPRWTSYADAQASGYGSMVMPEDTFNRRGGQVSGGQKYSSYQQYLDDMYDYFIGGSSNSGSSNAGKNEPKTLSEYEEALKADPEIYKIVTSAESFATSGAKTYFEYIKMMYKKYIKKYHSGGFVGDISTLKSNEQFAKLLKGEFVSTPAQMDKFMKETFPSMVSTANKGGNTYNAPLISIECGSITQETLPQVKAAVKAAVAEIKTQIDSGISRTGYRRSVNKFSR